MQHHVTFFLPPSQGTLNRSDLADLSVYVQAQIARIDRLAAEEKKATEAKKRITEADIVQGAVFDFAGERRTVIRAWQFEQNRYGYAMVDETCHVTLGTSLPSAAELAARASENGYRKA